MCNIIAAACRVATPNESLVGGSTDVELDNCEPFIGDLVPASASQICLISGGTDHHEKALDLMFRHFAAKKDFSVACSQGGQAACGDREGGRGFEFGAMAVLSLYDLGWGTVTMFFSLTNRVFQFDHM